MTTAPPTAAQGDRPVQKIADGLHEALGWANGAKSERAAIVEWLRYPDHPPAYRGLAVRIERGEHLRPERPAYTTLGLER